jgi:hypothetical protein
MEYFDEINSLKYLYLIDLKEPCDNQLIINIQEATISNRDESLEIGGKEIGPVRAISAGNGRKYRIYFDSYISYCVTNERYTVMYEYEERIGRLFCIYSKSYFLDHIKQHTIAEFLHENENVNIKHYSINCLNHVVDIVSISEPVTTTVL